MAEAAASLLPWLVALLLGAGLTRQFAVSGRTGLLLDRLAILPQWKFFGQATIASDPSAFDDLHLLARRIGHDGDPGDWQPLFWWDDRSVAGGLWNPGQRARTALAEALLDLVHSERTGATPLRPTALAYLAIVRQCLDSLPPADGEAIQFAIVHSRGRAGDMAIARPVALRFLSAWHCP